MGSSSGSGSGSGSGENDKNGVASLVLRQRQLGSGTASSSVHRYRYLGGGGNNNNNNYNNNNDDDYYGHYSGYNKNSKNSGAADEFNAWLFIGTALFCLMMFLYIIIRIKCHRRRENKRIKLGEPSLHVLKRSRRRTKSQSQDDNLISEDEIHKFVLPTKKENSYDEALHILKYDKETERILKLCKPFWFDAFIASVCDIVTASFIGRGIGVDALAIYYVVEVPTTFTSTLIGAVLSTVSTLGGQSIGVGSYKLTGQYCQISIVLVSSVLSIF
jgi:hypothetical protein